MPSASEPGLKSAWVDTHHQPGDTGTRPDPNGRLQLERPLFVCARLCLEIIAGCCRVTAAWASKGLATADPWDVELNVFHDLLKTRNQNRLFKLIASGHVIFAWWAPPCVLFSFARKFDGRGPRPLRDHENPDVIPSWVTSPADLQALEDSNTLATVTARGMRLGHGRGVINVVENPDRSSGWNFSPTEHALLDIGAESIATDFCAGPLDGETGSHAPWRKRTRLAGTLPGLRR